MVKYEPPRVFDARSFNRETLLEWSRANAPGLRIGYAVIDGERRCFARWTWRGVDYERESPDDTELVRMVATALARLMGVPTVEDRSEAMQLERDVLAAAMAGNDAMADALGRELVMKRAGLAPVRVPTRFGRI